MKPHVLASLVLLAPALALADEGAADSAAPAPREPAERRVRIGGRVLAGAAVVDGEAVPLYEWRTETGVRLGRGVSIGIMNTAGFNAGAEGTVAFVHGTPFVEVSRFVGARVEPYGRAGVLLRGHADTPERDLLLEAAPYLGGGARVYPTRGFSVGLEASAHLVVTDELTLGGVRLARGVVPVSAALSTAVHF